ncbi:oligosaccharide flippase family protein [Pedobacter gandavensis]|uniref:oligosaccharide flippase family protein n=1 Tax=Pedobacter gandavensis TaxID=2679963 RepID=UPI002478B622|nr:oligosaccharide flippase family protein [Pedobacter gandavensis]WGQ07517.1 oligosaccharide flippase family protein [Pedobacter gandavensis]
MDKESSSYKSTVKSTAIFGGAQGIQMLVTILRAKAIAIILGSHGMGVNAIFQSTIAIISSLSSFGIFQSAVRDISQEHETGDSSKLSRITLIFYRMVLAAGLLGLLICLCFSTLLSKWAFQNYDYTWHFAFLSVGVLFSALANGKTVFLQGTRNLISLAKASVLAALIGLSLAIPFFYYFGIFGIVLSINISSLLLYLTQLYFTRKIKLEKVNNLSLVQTINESKPIVKLGSILMLGMVVLTGFTYLTNVFIGRFGKIEDVGLFQGVSSITSQSIAIVIAVLASDFFPRLAAVFQDKQKVKLMVNQQAELVSIIITPITVILIVFAPLIIKVLLSSEFLVVVPMLRLISLSLLFRGVWLIMSYVILAKGDKKAYLIFDSLIGNGLLFLLNILAYSFWGLLGLGISYLAGSVSVSVILFFIVKIKYDFNFNSEFLKVYGLLILLALCSYSAACFLSGWAQYILSGIIVIVSLGYSMYVLNKRIGIFNKILQVVKGKKQ